MTKFLFLSFANDFFFSTFAQRVNGKRFNYRQSISLLSLTCVATVSSYKVNSCLISSPIKDL